MTSALFVEASEMSDGKARVKEASGGVYYINSSFERISDDYIDGFEYEHQGLFARVQLEDKTWGIIDWHGNLVLEGAESIQPLPLVTVYGSAIIGGNMTAPLSILFPTSGRKYLQKLPLLLSLYEVWLQEQNARYI